MNRIAALLVPLLLSVTACGDDGPTFVSDAESVSTFDTGLDGWAALDLGLAAGSAFSVENQDQALRFDFDVPEDGGEGVIVREYVVTPGVDYNVAIDLIVESSDGIGVVEPWTVVVGHSVEGGDFVFQDAFTTSTTAGTQAQVLPLFGDVGVTAGPPSGANDTTSEVRIAIGFRPETADSRTYRIDDVVVRFLREG